MQIIESQNKAEHLPILSWCPNVEDSALKQLRNLAMHPALSKKIAAMPDCHMGCGMPIGGVIASKNAILPAAVGVDAGCGMRFIKTNIRAEEFSDMEIRRIWLEIAKKLIPAGEGHAHKAEQEWDNFQGKENYGAHLSYSNLDRRNLGTIGGGNHFCELQKSDDGFVCIMVHSGSRNFGQRLEKAYLAYAQDLCETMHVRLPDPALAFLPMNMDIGKRSNQLLSETGDVKFDYSCPGWDYMVDLNLALEYALENRIRISNWAIDAIEEALGKEVSIAEAYDVHHNYAAIENHCGENLIVHRKGATRAMKDEIGIIPGSMGTASYIVKGLGNEASFCSCSHGAGRRMSRTTANTSLTVADCDSAMNGIVFDRWHKCKSFKDGQSVIDLSESPQAYKDIDEVIRNESDLVVPVLKLTPLAVLKG